MSKWFVKCLKNDAQRYILIIFHLFLTKMQHQIKEKLNFKHAMKKKKKSWTQSKAWPAAEHKTVQDHDVFKSSSTWEHLVFPDSTFADFHTSVHDFTISGILLSVFPAYHINMQPLQQTTDQCWPRSHWTTASLQTHFGSCLLAPAHTLAHTSGHTTGQVQHNYCKDLFGQCVLNKVNEKHAGH